MGLRITTTTTGRFYVSDHLGGIGELLADPDGDGVTFSPTGETFPDLTAAMTATAAALDVEPGRVVMASMLPGDRERGAVTWRGLAAGFALMLALLAAAYGSGRSSAELARHDAPRVTGCRLVLIHAGPVTDAAAYACGPDGTGDATVVTFAAEDSTGTRAELARAARHGCVRPDLVRSAYPADPELGPVLVACDGVTGSGLVTGSGR